MRVLRVLWKQQVSLNALSSEDDKKLRYINYIGDGGSKPYSDVVAHDPYHGKEVKK